MTAMVLPALFAACTNEELDVVNNVESMEGRAVVENVTFTVGETADSRLVYGKEGYTFQAGDQLGACLMDEITDLYGYTKKDGQDITWNQWFNLVNYIQTNYKFTRDADGNWETEAKLCEGNYFLSFPYNMNMGLREAYAFNCNEQVLEGTDAESLKKAYVANNAFVGYAQVKRSNNEGESVNVPLVPVFGATGIILTNRGIEERTIEKIVLRGEAVKTLAVVKPAGEEGKNGFDPETFVGLEEPEDIDNALAGIIEYSVNKNAEEPYIEVYVKSGNTLSSNGQKSMNIIVMSAPEDVAENTDNETSLVMDVYSTRGVIRDIDLTHELKAYDSDDIVTDNVITALGAGQKVEVEFSHASFDVEKEMDIYTDDDLAQLITWNAEANTKREITANIYNTVTLSKAMYDKIHSTEMITKVNVNIKNGALVIAADVAEDAMDNLAITDGIVKVLGTQNVEETPGCDIVWVAEGATLNAEADLMSVRNEGTLNIAEDQTYIENFGNLNVEADLTITTLKNHSKVTNNAALTLNNNSYNYATIDNNGTIIGKFENVEAYVCSECKVEHEGLINNNGEIEEVLNNGTIVMAADARVMTDASSTGYIDNTEKAEFVSEGTAETVFVSAQGITATDLAALVIEAGATEVRLAGTLTIDDDDVMVNGVKTIKTTADVLVTGKGKVAFKKTTFIASAGTEVIVDQYSTLSVNVLDVTYGKVSVKNGGKVMKNSQIGSNFKDYSNK